MKYKFFGLALGLLPIVGMADGNLENHFKKHFDDITPSTPGCAAGVVKAGKLVYENYAGLANLQYQVPISNQTVFKIGSVSKHMTAALIWQLEREGKLSRSDTLAKYYPDGPEWFSDITLYHLIHHQSGLPDFWNDPSTTASVVATLSADQQVVGGLLTGFAPSRETIFRVVLEHLKQLPKPGFEPGTGYSYDNTGYLLLADIAEKASGLSFDKLAHDKLFSPLGMADTRFTTPSDSHSIPWQAASYTTVDPDKGIYRAFDLFVSSTGHTGVATTLPDFSKWVANLMSPNETIVGPDFLALEDPAYGRVKTGRLSQYVNGLGFHRRSFGHFYGHYGSVAEYKSTFWFEPEKQLAYIQLCNYDFTDEPSKRAIVDGYKVY